jgi:hypothetical protein
MSDAIQPRLQQLTGDLAPICQAAERLLDPSAHIDAASANLLISHRPKTGPESYALVLYAGITDQMISAYLKARSTGLRGSLAIPPAWLRVLSILNGAELFEIHLYGLPPSLCGIRPLHSRSARQPLDLGAANAQWSRNYRPSRSQFNFGSGPFSYEENLAYFLNNDNTVEARRVGGSLFGSWPSLEKFFEEEISRAESLYPAWEARTEKLQNSIGLGDDQRFSRF